jgi:hypothetical protein
MGSREGCILASVGRAVSLVVTVLLAQTILVPAQPAGAAGLAPREIAITDDEAGRQAARAIDKDGQDGRSVWVQIRWERDQDSADATTGPATIENVVYVTKDLSSARALFNEQAAKNKDFPEAFYGHKGAFPFPITGIGDEVSGQSACLDCTAKDELRLHHRVTFRRGVVVATLYLYGAQSTTPQSLMTWYATQAANRVPAEATRAPERSAEQQAVSTPPGAESTQPPRRATVPLVLAEPKDLAIKIGEAGKGARVKIDRDGLDARGSWYEVRFEREGSGGRFYQGPVTVHNIVFVARDVDGARLTYQEQTALNEKVPEANRRVGQKFELKGANEIGEEATGVSACERSCNPGDEVYVHKRLVSRVANVVSVVYLWGLSHEEGTSDWHARYFGELVVTRSRGAASASPI